jgi:hypothetical protein
MAFELSSKLVDAAKGNGDAIRKKKETAAKLKSFRPNFLQHAQSFTTRIGITHSIPNILRTTFHKRISVKGGGFAMDISLTHTISQDQIIH